MSRERELLIRIVDNDKTCGLFFLTPKFKEQIKELLAQPEPRRDSHCYWCDGEYDAGARLAKLEQDKKSKVDFQTLSEMGLKRLQVSDDLVLQESCARSPTVIFAENGNLIEIIKYEKLLEIRSFIDEILNYADNTQIGVDDE